MIIFIFKWFVKITCTIIAICIILLIALEFIPGIFPVDLCDAGKEYPEIFNHIGHKGVIQRPLPGNIAQLFSGRYNISGGAIFNENGSVYMLPMDPTYALYRGFFPAGPSEPVFTNILAMLAEMRRAGILYVSRIEGDANLFNYIDSALQGRASMVPVGRPLHITDDVMQRLIHVMRYSYPTNL